jgi:hypothetical protein
MISGDPGFMSREDWEAQMHSLIVERGGIPA